ncbi:MAG: phytoene desaturase family protein [Alphaproteobacteria bacterium]
MTGSYDVIIVGGGHNGLVCAAYLGRAGRRVLVVEAAPGMGGCAVSAEFAPGFTVSAGAHILHMLHPQIARDLDLAGHGLRYANSEMATVALDPGGKHLVFKRALATDDSLAAHSATDVADLAALRRRLMRFAGLVREFQATVPPRLASAGWSNRLKLARLGWRLRRLGRDDMREFLRVAMINIADVLDDELESDLLKGAIGLDAVLGTNLGPRSPNSVFSLLYRLAGQANGTPGALALPEGGMGAVTGAMAAAAEAAGAELRTNAAVRQIVVENDRAAGVELESGETIRATAVVSNADPKTTFLTLLGTEHLDTGFVRRIANIRARGTTAKLHLALDSRPEFAGLEAAHLGGRLLIAPSLDYVERAFNPCKYGEVSPAPAIEITLPSITDRTLAPEGKHVLSAVVQYAPYALRGGWDAARDDFADTVVATIARYAPGLDRLIVAREMLTPVDIERRFGVSGGHWHHGELAPDQLFMMRPVPGAGQYDTPLPGLYLCGAGTHPGGGVMGAAGLNAASRLIECEAKR